MDQWCGDDVCGTGDIMTKLADWCRANPHLAAMEIERLTAPAQSTREPFGYVALYCGTELFMRMKGAADFYADLCEVVPLYTAASLPSTGLPAPAPHAEVREALEPFAKIAENYESSIERANRAIIDEAKCAGRGPVEDHALKQPLPDAHRVSVTIGDCRLARSVLVALALPQSTEHRCRNCGDPHTEIKEVFCGTCREMGCSPPSREREYDPNVALCDDAEFGMKP